MLKPCKIVLLIALTLSGMALIQAQKVSFDNNNLYYKALSVCLSKETEEFANIVPGRDLYNVAIANDYELTGNFPTQIGPHKVAYLDANGLIERYQKDTFYRKERQAIPVKVIRPLRNEGAKIIALIADYWFSYRQTRNKINLEYALEGGCNVTFRLDQDKQTFITDKVDIWGL